MGTLHAKTRDMSLLSVLPCKITAGVVFSSHWSINLCFKSTHDKIVVVWETMTCSWLDMCWCFEGNCCLCHISTYLLNTWYHMPEDCALRTCEILSSHSNTAEDWSLQGCDVSLCKWFLIFQSIMSPSSSWLKQLVVSCLTSEDNACHIPLKHLEPLTLQNITSTRLESSEQISPQECHISISHNFFLLFLF